MTHDVDTMKAKYPVNHGRDFGQRVTLADLLDRLEAALNADASEESQDDVACDVLDRDFLFGAWGDHWDKYDEWLLRDIRGLVIAAIRRDKAKAKSQEGQQTK